VRVGSDKDGRGAGVLGPADPQVLWVRVLEVRRAQQAHRGCRSRPCGRDAGGGRGRARRNGAGGGPDRGRHARANHVVLALASCQGSCCTGTCSAGAAWSCASMAMAAGPAEGDDIAIAGLVCIASRPSSTATSRSTRPPAARFIALLLRTGPRVGRRTHPRCCAKAREHTYNRRRRQRALGRLTPVEYELAFATRVDQAAA